MQSYPKSFVLPGWWLHRSARCQTRRSRAGPWARPRGGISSGCQGLFLPERWNALAPVWAARSREVGGADASTHQDLNVIPGGLHQLVEQGRSLRGTGCLPTGQDGGKLQLFGGFQRRKRVPADIKGAVQRASCRASGLPRGTAGSGIDGRSAAVSKSPSGVRAPVTMPSAPAATSSAASCSIWASS